MSILKISFCIVLSILIMTIDHYYQYLHSIRSVLSIAVYPFYYLINLPNHTKDWLGKNLAERITILQENAKLHENQILLNVQLQKLATLEAENRRLRSLLESVVHSSEHMLIAELIAVNFDQYRHNIILNRGEKHGIYIGQPVIDQLGIVGQIIRTNFLTSTAILITDINHAIPIQINRTGVRTLALGTGDLKELKLLHIPANEDIKVGDLLVTSGLDGRFPRGYPVGIITKFEPSSPFANIIAKPIANLDRLSEVILININKCLYYNENYIK